jgi:hypothetical protein
MLRFQNAIQQAATHWNDEAKKNKLEAYYGLHTFLDNVIILLFSEPFLDKDSIQKYMSTINFQNSQYWDTEEKNVWWWYPITFPSSIKTKVEDFVQSKKYIKNFVWAPKKNIWLDCKLYIQKLDRKTFLKHDYRVLEVNGTIFTTQLFLKCVVQKKKHDKKEYCLLPNEWLQDSTMEAIIRKDATFKIDINFGTAKLGKKHIDIVQFLDCKEYDLLFH